MTCNNDDISSITADWSSRYRRRSSIAGRLIKQRHTFLHAACCSKLTWHCFWTLAYMTWALAGLDAVGFQWIEMQLGTQPASCTLLPYLVLLLGVGLHDQDAGGAGGGGDLRLDAVPLRAHPLDRRAEALAGIHAAPPLVDVPAKRALKQLE